MSLSWLQLTRNTNCNCPKFWSGVMSLSWLQLTRDRHRNFSKFWIGVISRIRLQPDKLSCVNEL